MTDGFTMDHAVLYTDGGSRGNPGHSGIGFTIYSADDDNMVAVCNGGAYIGTATSNIAEYRALIWGLQNARTLGIKRLDIRADSELLVRQLNGEYRVKNEGIKPLFNDVRYLLEGFESFEVSHVPREDNNEADRLANEAMDIQGMTGKYAVAYEAGGLFSGGTEGDDELTGGRGDFVNFPKKLTKSPRHKSTSQGVYTLTVKEHFDAAHALIGYPGQCKDLHGHTWDIEATVRGTRLDDVGIVYDFKNLKDNLKQILDAYDHVYLNEVSPFDTMNATAENLACVIYEQMEALLPEGIDLVEIAVWESPLARLSYSRLP